jgi:glutaredoxin
VFVATALVLGAVALATTAHAEVYRWVDKNGVVHFGDTPPADIQTTEVEIKNSAVTTGQDTADTEPTKQLVRRRVVLYSASWCTVCEQAKRWFRQNDIAFREYDIEKSDKGRRDYKKLNGRGVPIILVDGDRLNGFNPQSFMQLYQQES